VPPSDSGQDSWYRRGSCNMRPRGPRRTRTQHRFHLNSMLRLGNRNSAQCRIVRKFGTGLTRVNASNSAIALTANTMRMQASFPFHRGQLEADTPLAQAFPYIPLPIVSRQKRGLCRGVCQIQSVSTVPIPKASSQFPRHHSSSAQHLALPCLLASIAYGLATHRGHSPRERSINGK
jgi:hypothetical protein